jgi:serine-type D-Ala-D-Ala carboxypeptidase (penicillin-binding protein 5/6)
MRAGAGDSRGGPLRVRAALACALAVAAIGVAAQPAPSQAPPGNKAQPDQPAQAGQAPARQGAGAASQPPRLAAKAWVLIDARDGEVLAAKGANRRLPIASATKLMTAYLALKRLKPNQMVTAAPYRPSFSAEILLGLRAGEKMSTRDLLYGLLLPSANDAAHTLAVGVSGSEAEFVTQMNQAAQRLGLDDTSYSNPIGLDDPNNYSSARDLVTLADELLANRLFARIVDTPSVTLRSGDRPRSITTRDTLILEQPFVNGVKTGHTLGAGYVLVGSGTRDSTTLISAVLGAPSEAARDAETLELLNYGFSLYRTTTPVERGAEFADPDLDYRSEDLPLVAKDAIEVKTREGQTVETTVDAPGEVSGAVEEGESLGEVTVTVDGETAASTPLVASRSVEAASLADKAVATAQNPVLLLALGAIVIVVGMLIATRGRRPASGEQPPNNGRRERREPRERTPDERRRMHEERMKRRRERMERGEGR